MQKILLTGATGFIGQSTIPYLLRRDYSVHAVTSSPHKIQNQSVVWHHVDLLNAAEVTTLIQDLRPSHLLHLAWYVQPGRFWDAEENLDWLRASLFLAEQFALYGGKRIVTAGTCAEYDWTAAAAGPLSEGDSRMRPHTLYGAAKYALYVVLEKFAETANLSFASGRIFFPFGPNEPPERVIPSVIRSLLRNEQASTSAATQVRDLMYVEDVAKAFVALVDSEVTGAVNVGSGTGTSLREVVETIGDILQRSELLRIGALPSRSNDPSKIVADVTRLREEVGFNSNFDLSASLTTTIEWWKKNI